MPSSVLHEPLLEWYAANARDLPWRGPSATPWSVMVSEFMLQQTPVSRVLPVHEYWMERWPTPAHLAAAPSGEAVRAWGRLGYPRRALRLHASAVAITEQHGGVVPASYDELLALPGVGDYTAAAIASFAYGKRQVVLDTNVRRVLTRLLGGVAFQPDGSPGKAERARAEEVLPDEEPVAAEWSVALMELGALVCTATDPGCRRCPLTPHCAWVAAGHPAYDGPPRRGQTYAGTDRQCRGRILALVRDSEGPVAKQRIDLVWDNPHQRERCLASLVEDGLLTQVGQAAFALPMS